MAELNLIFLGIGAVALLVALIVLIDKLIKDSGKISGGIISLLVLGAAFIIAGFVTPSEMKGIMPVVGGATTDNSKIEIGSKEQSKETEGTPESNGYDSGVVAMINDDFVINESDPLVIARLLVEHEMAKQVGLSSWEITNNRITSDTNVFNVADYDKPMGDMRKVWIEGNVKATAADDGTTGNVGFTLELYQMREQDPNWYVGNHWGVLIALPVTKQPNYVEDERYFSNSGELIIDEENGGLFSVNVPEYGQSFEEANPDRVTSAEDLIGAWYWREYDDMYMLLRADGSYSYVEKNAAFFVEGIYSVEAINDEYKVRVQYITGEKDSMMTIKLRDKNRLKATEEGYSWDAKRVDATEVERILKGVKGM